MCELLLSLWNQMLVHALAISGKLSRGNYSMNCHVHGAITESIPMLQDHLALAEVHVATSARNIARQRATLQELQRKGHNTEIAEMLLAQFKRLQASHIAGRNRIRVELSEAQRALSREPRA
jgi:hypothetical protein